MKFDMHVHTTASPDSIMKTEELFAIAKRRGLDGLAVSNHNVLENVSGKDGIYIIPACEVSTDAGHMLVYFLKSDICSEMTKDQNGLYPWREVVKAAHSQGALVFVAHPFSPKISRESEVWEQVDGVEIFNSRVIHSRIFDANENALALCREKKLAFSAGSDAHSPGELGVAYWECPLDASETEADDLEEKLKAELLSARGKVFAGYSSRKIVFSCRRKTYITRKLRKKHIKSYFITTYLALRDLFCGKKKNGYYIEL